MVVKTRHHTLDIVAVKRIEVALNQFFFGCHFDLPR
jgi:hypothetical protein